MGRSRYQVFGTQPHFITCTTVEWLPLFAQPELTTIVLESLGFLQAHQRLRLHGYVIMENHLHLIAAAADLSKQIGYFKSFTAREIVDWLKEHQNGGVLLKQLEQAKLAHKYQQTYQVWQEGCHPQMIGSEVMLRQKLEYIHQNPVRRGYVDDPVDWRYSSYRNYVGEAGLLEVTLLG